jgi:Papain-like cysteine protease AvrRpt2
MRFRLVACNLLTVVVLAGCCTPKSDEILPVTFHQSERKLWCWAASGKMIMEYMGASVEQCNQANERFVRSDCCTVPGACVNGGWPEFFRYGFTFARTFNAALSWDEIKNQIYCKEKPFAFSYKYPPPDRGGHMMVAVGYKTDQAGISWVYVYDPGSGPGPGTGAGISFIPYETYADPQPFTHWDDFYNITKN